MNRERAENLKIQLFVWMILTHMDPNLMGSSYPDPDRVVKDWIRSHNETDARNIVTYDKKMNTVVY
jgi:hypothetical protein